MQNQLFFYQQTPVHQIPNLNRSSRWTHLDVNICIGYCGPAFFMIPVRFQELWVGLGWPTGFAELASLAPYHSDS